MTDSPTPSTPQPLLSASSYCALIAADTAEAATLRQLVAESQGTTLAIDTSPQDAVELLTDPASPQTPAAQVSPIETASRDWLLRTDDSSHGLADGVTSILLPAGTITEPADTERLLILRTDRRRHGRGGNPPPTRRRVPGHDPRHRHLPSGRRRAAHGPRLPADARGAGLPHRDGEPRLATQDRRLLPRPR